MRLRRQIPAAILQVNIPILSSCVSPELTTALLLFARGMQIYSINAILSKASFLRPDTRLRKTEPSHRNLHRQRFLKRRSKRIRIGKGRLRYERRLRPSQTTRTITFLSNRRAMN
jgi:hypothetical protein